MDVLADARKICRLCLEKRIDLQIISDNLVGIYREFFGYKIQVGPDNEKKIWLSQRVCEKCIGQLTALGQFKKMISKNEKLMKVLKSTFDANSDVKVNVQNNDDYIDDDVQVVEENENEFQADQLIDLTGDTIVKTENLNDINQNVQMFEQPSEATEKGSTVQVVVVHDKVLEGGSQRYKPMVPFKLRNAQLKLRALKKKSRPYDRDHPWEPTKRGYFC